MKVKTPLALASQLLKNFAQDADNLEASNRLKNIDVGVFLNAHQRSCLDIVISSVGHQELDGSSRSGA